VDQVDFVVDTGSTKSLLMPRDWERMGLHYSDLRSEGSGLGAGGLTAFRREDAILLFSDSAGVAVGFSLQFGFAEPHAGLSRLPSILGMDVLRRTRMLLDPARDFLALKVTRPDVRVPWVGRESDS
jgi:hypothetical protein